MSILTSVPTKSLAGTKKDVEKELLEVFPELKGAVNLPDYVKIGKFLGNPDKVRATLASMENDLEQKLFQGIKHTDKVLSLTSLKEWFTKKSRERDLQKHYDGAIDRFKKRQDGKDVAPSPFKHFVTTYLGEMERAAGFVIIDPSLSHMPYKVMLMAPLAAETFQKNLQEKRHWKDYVNPAHGEYTHRLQWGILLKAAKLNTNAADVYESIGKMQLKTLPSGATCTAWDALFDRRKLEEAGTFPFIAATKNDLRCPEYLLDWLCSPQQLKDYPVLAGFFKARRDKRLYQQSKQFEMKDYIALKIYNSDYDQLDEKTKDLINDFLVGGVSVDPKQHDNMTGLLKPTPGSYEKPRLPS